jgi:hypothetical protein
MASSAAPSHDSLQKTENSVRNHLMSLTSHPFDNLWSMHDEPIFRAMLWREIKCYMPFNGGPVAAKARASACLTYRIQLAQAVHHFIYAELSMFAPSSILDALYFLTSYV